MVVDIGGGTTDVAVFSLGGIVLSESVEEGQTVAASFSTPTLFTIAKDLTNMQVVADVDEADIGNVKVGERVTFTADAYPDNTFSGTVTQVRQEATTTNNVVTYSVVISAPNADLKLKPGLTATVTIYTQENKGVLSVPSKALRFTPEKEAVGGEDYAAAQAYFARRLDGVEGMTEIFPDLTNIGHRHIVDHVRGVEHHAYHQQENDNDWKT